MVLKAKHSVEEINGIRCTLVEKGASPDRIKFLKNLLEYNNFQVEIAEEAQVNSESPKLFTIGVTDLIFNPVIAVFEKSLKTPKGQSVSPAYWEQLSSDSKDQYWDLKR